MVGKHETSTQTNDLEIRQKNLQTKQSKRTPTDENAEKHSQKRGKETTKQYNQYKNNKQTKQIQRQKEEAARIQTKQAWNNDGERPTQFFCNLEKRRLDN